MADEIKKESNPDAGMKSEDGNAADKSAETSPDTMRRGLIKAGMVAAPLILTLKGTSALAGNTASKSAWLSANWSHH